MPAHTNSNSCAFLSIRIEKPLCKYFEDFYRQLLFVTLISVVFKVPFFLRSCSSKWSQAVIPENKSPLFVWGRRGIESWWLYPFVLVFDAKKVPLFDAELRGTIQHMVARFQHIINIIYGLVLFDCMSVIGLLNLSLAALLHKKGSSPIKEDVAKYQLDFDVIIL